MATTTLSAAPTGDTDTAEEPPKSKKKLMIIGIVVLLVVGAAGYFFLGRKSGPPPPPVPGAVVVSDPVTINLEGGHYLRLGLALQATKKAKETPDASHAQDLAVTLLSNRSVAALSSNTARAKLKKELTGQIVKAYDDAVMAIYFTEFVIQ